MKLQNLKNLPFFIIDLMFLTVVVLLPGSLQDIPQWAWAIFLIVFMGYCLVSLAREGFVEKFLKRGAIAMLLFIPFIALITLLPGGDPHRDFSWWWLMGLVLAPLAVLAVIAWRTNFFNQVKEMFASKRRPKTCESCGESTDRTHFLDGTWRNKYEGNQTYLCLGCLRNELAEHYATLRNRCVVAEPVAQPKTLGSPSNAYYAYTNSDEDIDLASVATDGEDRAEARNALDKLLDQAGGTCTRCGRDLANYLWVPSDRFKGKWTDFSLPKIANGDQPGQAICAACVTDKVIEAIKAKRLRLAELWAPRDGTVLMFSGEA